MAAPTAATATAASESPVERAAAAVADEAPGVRALIVMREGEPLLERYYGGASAAEPFETHSITKSVLSLLVGVAIAEGDLPGVDARVGDLLDVPRNADPRVRDITLRQLLTMTAGWDDEPVRGPDVVAALLERPLARAPGARWTYDSGSAHLVSAMLARATARSAAQYAEEKLFSPLGIQPLDWPADPQGVTSGGAGLVLRARELALLGELVRNDGRWGDERLVPAEWVRESTRRQVDTDDPDLGYGYLWFVNGRLGVYAAVGYGGQLLAVAPEADAVVVVTGVPEAAPDQRRVLELLLPALRP